MSTFGVYVGRFCPIHKGHERVVRQMLERFDPSNVLIVVGSSNAAFSLRNFFSYKERKEFIKLVFPEIKSIVGLPDYHNDEIWLSAFDDILALGGIDPGRTTFFGGCKEDIRFFLEDGRNCEIVNRFAKKEDTISATEVRDHLIQGRKKALKEALNPLVYEAVVSTFQTKWEMFKRI